MANVTDLLMALGSPDPAVRVPAETAVNEARDADLATFMTTMLNEFRDETKPTFARNIAGTLLKNAVVPSFREVAARRALEERWRALPAEVRQHIKNEILGTLGSPSQEVRKVASNVIGSLARIELPAGEWPQLVQILVGAANSPAEQHQEAALTAIGYICEEGKDHEEVEEALRSSTTDILSSILKCMQSTNEDVKFSATNALCNAMEYIHDNMDVQEQRVCLVSALCVTAASSTAARTRERAMQSLVKVAEIYYSMLPEFIAQLHEITTKAILEDEEAVGLQAIQFWISICEVEREKKEDGDMESNLKYSNLGMTFLVDICEKLLVRQEEDQTEDDWNLSVAGGKLLQSLAAAVGAVAQRPVMEFVYKNINSTSWREREAAVMAFGCVIGVQEDEDKEAIQDTVAQAVPGLLNYLRDSNAMVADTSAWVLALVCEGYVEVFLANAQQLQRLMNEVGPMIGGNNSHMAIRACHIVYNIALAFEDEEAQQTNVISCYYGDLVSMLLHAIDHGDSVELKSQAQETLNAVIDAAANDSRDSVLAALPTELLRRLEAIMVVMLSPGNDKTEAETMMGLLCGALSSLTRKLGQGFMPYFEAAMRDLIQLLNLSNDFVQDETLVAIGSIAYVAQANMAPFLPEVVPHVLRSLQAFDEPDSIHSVVAAVGDLSLSCRQALLPYESDVMNTLYNNLVSPDVDRDLKCTFLSCLGDFILSVLEGQRFAPYAPTLMPLVHQLFQASCQIDIRGDPDGEEYVMSLWERTAGFYSSVIECFKAGPIVALVPYLSNLLGFALHAAMNAGGFEETQMAAMMTIGDMAIVLRKTTDLQLLQQAKEALLTPAVNRAMDKAMGDASNGDMKKQMRWVRTQLTNLERS